MCTINALYFLSPTKYRSGVVEPFKINAMIQVSQLGTMQRPCEQNYIFSATKQLVSWYCISWLEVNDS